MLSVVDDDGKRESVGAAVSDCDDDGVGYSCDDDFINRHYKDKIVCVMQNGGVIIVSSFSLCGGVSDSMVWWDV